MNDELKAIYQEIILDHNRQPRNFGELPDADHEGEGYNPLCGDQLKIYVRLDGDRIMGGVSCTCRWMTFISYAAQS